VASDGAKHFRAAAWAAAGLALSCLALGPPAALAQSAPVPAVTAPPAPERVLFLGNTLIYNSGELQSYTHHLAAAATPPLHLEKGFRSAHLTDVGLDAHPLASLLTPGRLGVQEPFQIAVLAGSSRDALSDASLRPQRDRPALILQFATRGPIYHPTGWCTDGASS
jgi:hypothetical protein